MLAYLQDASTISERIHGAAIRTAASVLDGTVNQEPHFTDRLLSRIEDAVNESTNMNAHWRARTLSDRGRGAEESIVGADFLGVFEVITTEVVIAKGFLAQAKLLEVSAALDGSGLARLREQCRRMLDISPDAFVFLYSAKGVRVVSANAVFGSSERRLDELGTKSIGEFFTDHFRCFIGDESLGHPSIIDLLKYYPPHRPISVARFVRAALRVTVLE